VARDALEVVAYGPRHYYATLLIDVGASVKTVQLALGHSTPTIMFNEYVDERPDAWTVPGRSSVVLSENRKRRPPQPGSRA
jgi:integrase